jgi:hypothetical protein
MSVGGGLLCPCCHCTNRSHRFTGSTMRVPPSSRLLIRDVPILPRGNQYRLCRPCTTIHLRPDRWKDSLTHTVPGPPHEKAQPIVLPSPPPHLPRRPYRPFDYSALPRRVRVPRCKRPVTVSSSGASDGIVTVRDVSLNPSGSEAPSPTIPTPEREFQPPIATPHPSPSPPANEQLSLSSTRSSLIPVSTSPVAAAAAAAALKACVMRSSLTYDDGDNEETSSRPSSPETNSSSAPATNDLPELDKFPPSLAYNVVLRRQLTSSFPPYLSCRPP